MIIKKPMWNDSLEEWTEDELLSMQYQDICYGKGGGSSPPPPCLLYTSDAADE